MTSSITIRTCRRFPMPNMTRWCARTASWRCAFRTWFGWQPNAKAAVLLFGFFHGFGLATKLQELELAREGLVPNMIAFNVGVEIGQLLALSAILLVMNYWRRTTSFARHAYNANVVLLTAGFVLTGLQLTGYAIGQ